MPSQAFTRFNGLVSYVDQLIGIHGNLQQGRGRRFEQEAIHRAGVVLMVGAWEGYVEHILREILQLLANSVVGPVPPAGGPPVPPPGVPLWAQHTFALSEGRHREPNQSVQHAQFRQREASFSGERWLRPMAPLDMVFSETELECGHHAEPARLLASKSVTVSHTGVAYRTISIGFAGTTDSRG